MYSTCAVKSIYDISILILTKPNEIFKSRPENPWDFYMYINVHAYNTITFLNDVGSTLNFFFGGGVLSA